jgi:uncharacterized protein (TIGR03437 family)
VISDFSVPPPQDWIARVTEFQVLLDGRAVDSSLITYVGSIPLCVGLFQINLDLPAWVGPNPEIRIALNDPVNGDRLSPPGTVLPVD